MHNVHHRQKPVIANPLPVYTCHRIVGVAHDVINGD